MSNLAYTPKSDTPMWRVLATAGFFGPDHTLYDEGMEIEYDGEPNEELEPLNQAAHDKLVVYLEKLDMLGKEAAVKANRPWVGRPRNLDGQLSLASAIQKSEMGILGAKTQTSHETIVKLEKSDTVNMTPDTGLTDVKRRRGRPSGSQNKVKTLSSS